MSSSHHDDPLSRALAGWRVNPRPAPDFRAAVWSRIHAADAPTNWSAFARGHAALVSSLLVVGVLLGALTGRNEARERSDADRTTIAANYVHSLDARWMRNP